MNIYAEALAVQDACNLSGVVHSFARVFEIIRAEPGNHGTDYVNKHPVCVLFADKIAHLTGTQYLGLTGDNPIDAAYRVCHDKTKEAAFNVNG